MRLHLLCSASTAAVSTVAFAAANEPLDTRGLESLSKILGRQPSCDIVLHSPALCAAQTVDGLGLAATVEPLLRDCDFGRWTGRPLDEVQAREPSAMAVWLQDPRAAPHGGESFADVTERVGGWMDQLSGCDGSILAITHALVIRAAIARTLGTGAAIFRYLDIAPLTRAKLSSGGRRWTLASLVSPRDLR